MRPSCLLREVHSRVRGWTIDPSGLLLECRLPIERQLTNVPRVDSCTRSLIATADNRVPQNACPVCRAEIIVWEQLGEDDDAFTYRQPAGPVPGPIKTKPPRPPDPARSPDAAALDQEPFVLLFPESGSVGISLARPWRGPQGLMHSVRDVSFGSPADDLGCPTGGVILHVNGVSVIGMSRAEVLQRTQERPLRIVMRLPLAGEWPIPDPPNQPPLRATAIPKGCWDVQYTVTLPPSVVAGETLIVAMPPEYTVHVAFVVPRTVAPGAQLLLKVAPEDLQKLRKSRGRLALIGWILFRRARP